MALVLVDDRNRPVGLLPEPTAARSAAWRSEVSALQAAAVPAVLAESRGMAELRGRVERAGGQGRHHG